MHEVVYCESGFGGLTNNNNYRRVVHIKYQSSESAQLIISEGSPYEISIVGVGPIDIHQRVVH